MNNTTKQLFYLKTCCLIRRIALLLFLAASTLFLQAQSGIWTGGGNGTDWDQATNWSFSGGGGFDASTEFVIPAGAGPTTANGTSLTMGPLTP